MAFETGEESNHRREATTTAACFAPLALAPANSAIRHASERLERELAMYSFTQAGKSQHFEIGGDKRIYQHLSGSVPLEA